MSAFLDRLIQPQRMAALEPFARETIMVTRLAVLAARRDVAPLPVLQRRLGDAHQAARFMHLTEVVAAAWPERFALAPPCCPTLTPDELLLAGLADAVADGDAPRFERMAREMLGEDARRILWQELAVVAVVRAQCVRPPVQP